MVGGGHEAPPGSPAGTALLCCSAGTGKQVNNLSCLETGKSNGAFVKIQLVVRLPLGLFLPPAWVVSAEAVSLGGQT